MIVADGAIRAEIPSDWYPSSDDGVPQRSSSTPVELTDLSDLELVPVVVFLPASDGFDRLRATVARSGVIIDSPDTAVIASGFASELFATETEPTSIDLGEYVGHVVSGTRVSDEVASTVVVVALGGDVIIVEVIGDPEFAEAFIGSLDLSGLTG